MVFVDDKGSSEPTLSANAGDTIEIVLEGGEGAEHDLVIPELNVASAKFSAGTSKRPLALQGAARAPHLLLLDSRPPADRHGGKNSR